MDDLFWVFDFPLLLLMDSWSKCHEEKWGVRRRQQRGNFERPQKIGNPFFWFVLSSLLLVSQWLVRSWQTIPLQEWSRMWSVVQWRHKPIGRVLSKYISCQHVHSSSPKYILKQAIELNRLVLTRSLRSKKKDWGRQGIKVFKNNDI